MKVFNTEAMCTPEENYMVDISDKVAEIKKLVDAGKYFTINRARQFGKTTTMNALKRVLKEEYNVIALDFQDIDFDVFKTGGDFTQTFAQLILDEHEFSGMPIPVEYCNALEIIADTEPEKLKMHEIFRVIRRWCMNTDKPIVLMIDEVDSAANNQVFLDFLAQLRSLYIKRQGDPRQKTLHSVILAGVTDIKHLKYKIGSTGSDKENSPWNISAAFNIDMTLSAKGIKEMLDDYKSEHNIAMNTLEMAEHIYKYTRGYPFLVSRICQIIDKELVPSRFASLNDAWTINGFDETIKILMVENNTLFDSLKAKLTNYPVLREKLKGILLRGDTLEYLPDDEAQKQLRMFGFIRNEHNTCVVFCRIFEMRLYKQFLGESKYDDLKQLGTSEKSIFIENDILNVPKIMQHFIDSQRFIYDRLKGETDDEAEKRVEKFLEKEGRERFLTYLSPIINGVGTYSIEEQTRDSKRMDIVIHYLGRRYVIEVKIWRGERYNADGEQQLIGYLDRFGLDTGYMLSFNFNKNKKVGVERISVGGKTLYEGTL